MFGRGRRGGAGGERRGGGVGGEGAFLSLFRFGAGTRAGDEEDGGRCEGWDG